MHQDKGETPTGEVSPSLQPNPATLMDLDHFTHHTALPDTWLSRKLDSLLNIIGNLMSWTWVVLMAIIIINVVMRYLFDEGRIEFEEIQWHLYSIGWLFGLSYCFVADDHVRVDLIHDRLSLRSQAWIELLGILLLLTPFLFIVLWYSVPFILYSWQVGEVSDSPGGLPYRWIIKSVLFIGFALLALATLSRLSRVCALLFLRKSPPRATVA
ncbi:MAG: TRAP transporter small permease subunit [Motiliproteus sp.]